MIEWEWLPATATVGAATPAAAAIATAATTVGAALLRAEAIRAIDRPVATRLKRHTGLLATGGTGGGEHLPLTTVAAAVGRLTAVTAPLIATIRAAPWLVGIALLRVICLIIRAEGKVCATVGTRKGSVGVTHSTTSRKGGQSSVIERGDG
jgi:hypothetical protein